MLVQPFKLITKKGKKGQRKNREKTKNKTYEKKFFSFCSISLKFQNIPIKMENKIAKI